MRRFMRNLVAAFGIGLTVLSAFSLSANALTIPPTYTPRMFQTQQKHYLRFVFNYNTCILASNACSIKVGSIPVNAFLTDVWIDPTTAFNSGGNDELSLGTCTGTQTTVCTNKGILSGSSTNLQGSLLHFCGTSCGTGTFAGIGLAVTNATATGSNGGFDVFVYYQQTSTAPTAGTAVVVLEYVAPNDGVCTQSMQALGATSPAVC